MRIKRFSGAAMRRRKIGIHLAIPIFLLLCGFALIIYAGWNQFSQAYLLSKVMIQPVAQQLEGTNKITVVDKKIKFPKLGEQFGTIAIPSVGMNYPLIHGDYDEQLAKGVGHFDGSKFPGEGGNIVLDGHRETVFRKLGKAKIGDLVSVETTYGEYKYKISEIRIVKENDTTIVIPSDQEKLTMYTCYPFDTIGYKPERYVVWAELVEGTPLKELLLKEGQ